MRKSPVQLIVFGVAMLLGAVGLFLEIFQMVASPATYNWANLIVPIILIVVLFLILRSTSGMAGRSYNGPKVKPSARTMAKMNGSQKNSYKSTSSRPSNSHQPKPKKNYPFQVIQGNKGKDDDEAPKFH
ncbi:hypothetical protein ACFSGI_06905 [Paenibacillus nicotianae]|uniref:Uncharacterized protein n=1 Tax=Paenibacillus nicotianae TaxID=1526551 RepID=A0ABW4UQ70_9BACL